MANLLDTCSERDGQEPDQWDQCNQSKPWLPSRRKEAVVTFGSQVHLENDRGCEAERDAREELVGDAEERPQGVDATKRIAHALNEEISPTSDHERAGENVRVCATHIPKGFPDIAEHVLQQVAAHTRAGVQGGEDE